ncbi:MAG: ABC transporter substrate-binding protein, partial [Candidatus Gastranaerophilales bacterium]|nr:ABC transporter substrate-binding protein [Candidatus Gastranaerophilales bacterium]
SKYTIDCSGVKDNPDAIPLNKPYPKPVTRTIDGVDYLQSSAPVGKFGGKLVSSTIGEGPKTFNPFTATDATSSTMGDMMYDGLFSSDPMTGEVVPKLAKSVEIKGNRYIIHLRRGIKWSDGKPVSADDVFFTWNDIIFAGLGNTSTRDSMVIDGELPKIRKIDNYTVEFTIKKQFAPFLRMLSASIAPKHYFMADKNWRKNFNQFLSTNTDPETIVSNGAFRLKEYIPAQRVIFVRNPDYYIINRNGEKLPYLDRIIYLIVGDLNNQILKFEAKELDEISLRGGDVARYKAKEHNSDYVIYNLGADTGTMFAAINLNRRYTTSKGKKEYYVNPVKQVWFNDLNFRKAIDYATDRKSMVQNIANGMASPLFTAESKNSIFYNKALKGHDRNLDIAKSYLKKSGFYLKKGKLYDKHNNSVEFDLYTNAGNTEREALGVMLKQDLADLGMQINFKPIEFNSLVNKITNSYDWDMVIMGLTGSPVEPHNGKNVWYSSGPLHLFNQRAAGTVVCDRLDWEKSLDDIFDRAALELDFSARKRYYDEYQNIIYNQAPIIYLYSPIRIYAIRRKFKNIYPSTLSGITHNIEEIYIDKEQCGQ